MKPEESETLSKQAEAALQESEKRYRFLFENMMDGFAYCKMLFDDEGLPADFVYLDVNSAFGRLTGLENVVGKKVTEVIPGIKESHPELFEIYGRVASTGQSEIFEIELKPLGKWFSISVYSPEREYFVAVFDNITERKRAEEALLESEEHFKVIAETAPVGLGVVGIPEANFLYVNTSYEKAFGYAEGELLGRRTPEIYWDQADRDRILKLLKEKGNVADYEVRLKRKDGTLFWGMASARPINFEGKAALMGVFTDITERKRAEEALARSSRRVSEILESITDGFMAIDNSWRFTYVNQRAAGNLGLKPEDLIGQNIWEKFPAIVGTNHEIYYRKAMQQHEPQYFEIHGVLTDKWYEIRVYPSAEGISVFWQDITERKLAGEALKESEERLRFALETSHIGAWDLDLVDHTAHRSLEHDRIFGYEQLLPKWTYEMFLDHVLPEDRATVDAKFLDATATHSNWSFECRIRRIDGEVRWIWAAGRHQEDATGSAHRMVGIVQDITERKRAEEALRKAHDELELRVQERTAELARANEGVKTERQRFNDILNMLPAYLVLLSPDYHVPFANRFFRERFGESHGFRCFEYLFKRCEPCEICETYTVLKTMAPHHWEWTGPDGRNYDIFDFPFTDTDGSNLIMEVGIDITERKQAEEKIREQAALLDKAQDAIGVRDLEHRLIYWNKGAQRMYGWTAEEAIGKNADRLIYKEESPQLIEAKKSVIEEGEWIGKLHQVTKDGKEIIVKSHWTLVRDNEGKPKSILIINTDITEKEKLESQLLRAQRMESIGTLAGGIAHDLNNMLTPVMMSLQMLKEKFKDEQSQKLLTILEQNSQRSADLIKQVLSFARGVEGERNPLQARHIINEIEKIAKETFPRNIEIRTNIPKDLFIISGDATQLHQVMMNLCVNARDAMPDGGILSITASNFFIDENYARMHTEAKVGSYTTIAVSDTGTGIPHKILDRVFEPFFTTKEFGKGTGLGLSTALAIVKSHGGFINVNSEVGKGTTFRVYLPAIKTEMQDVEEQKLELPTGNGELVLVTEDEDSVRDVTVSTLEKYGYSVLAANDGAQAVAEYAQNKDKIKVILMDMMMPVMDGHASIRAIRKINPEVKIIAASGLAEKEKLKNVADYTNAFLPKPYTAERLLKTIHEVLSAK